MADQIPAGLRKADITIFKCATKAAQLQSFKPIVAYWCEYWVVNQILAKQLHTTDEEILSYTTGLMDKLEQTKLEYANEAAVTDDTAGQAYVEQFAQETLDRAERVVQANKVTQQTATTFDAAATFFHLVNIWGPADHETQQKIKYAKWNAARIAKAIKEGKDPNESNPVPQEVQPALDPNDPEVQALENELAARGPKPATVEDVPEQDAQKAAGLPLPQTPASSSLHRDEPELTLPGVPTNLADPAPSVPHGYFDAPTIPSPASPPEQHLDEYQPSPDAPSAPADWAPTPPPAAPATFPPPSADVWQRPQPTPASQTPNLPPTGGVAPPPKAQAAPSHVQPAPTVHGTHSPATQYAAGGPGGVVPDERAIATAQKHARWAISALNFEDVPTAVRELRNALAQLGAI